MFKENWSTFSLISHCTVHLSLSTYGSEFCCKKGFLFIFSDILWQYSSMISKRTLNRSNVKDRLQNWWILLQADTKELIYIFNQNMLGNGLSSWKTAEPLGFASSVPLFFPVEIADALFKSIRSSFSLMRHFSYIIFLWNRVIFLIKNNLDQYILQIWGEDLPVAWLAETFIIKNVKRTKGERVYIEVTNPTINLIHVNRSIK